LSPGNYIPSCVTPGLSYKGSSSNKPTCNLILPALANDIFGKQKNTNRTKNRKYLLSTQAFVAIVESISGQLLVFEKMVVRIT
jgi:hypothetical protein